MFTLLRRYWSDLVSYDGGMSLLLIDGLLLVHVIIFAFFYPIQVLIGVGAVHVLTKAAYEGVVIWRKRHPHGAPHAHV